LAELSLEDLQTAYSWSSPQVEALYELEKHYGHHSSGLSWLAEFAQVEQLAEFRDIELNRRVALATLQVVHRRARRLVQLRCLSLDSSLSVGQSVLRELRRGSVVVIDVSGLQSTEELLVASNLSRRVFDAWQDAYVNRREEFAALPVVSIVLEEAQRVLAKSRDGDLNVFPRIAREGRKFKVGLCAVSQQPRLIDDELLSQLSTFLILGLADEKDRAVLRGSAKRDVSDLGPEIQTLMEGEALLVNLDTPFALPTLVDFYDDVVRNTPAPARAARSAPPSVSGLVD
jgi:DNA helicase HerA-like ATPase